MRAEGINYSAHRFSWELHNGPIPEGLLVCHTCDRRWCVNPKHLFVGTHQDNVDDMWRKGRGVGGTVRGEGFSSAKLTDKKVLEIRKRYADGETQMELAAAFSVAQTSISKVVRHQGWKHIP